MTRNNDLVAGHGVDQRRESVLSAAGYEFNPHSREWILDHKQKLNWAWADDLLTPVLAESFRNVLRVYAESYSPRHTSNLSYSLRYYALYVGADREPLTAIRSTDLISYRANLDQKNIYRLGVLKGLIKKWKGLGLPGVESGVIDLLDSWRLPGNTKGEAVRNRSPVQGPLSLFEFEALKLRLVEAFGDGAIDLENYICLELFIATGRRPKQIAELKGCDLIEERASDGLMAYVLNIPRAKQRSSRSREEFKPFALTPELGAAVKALIQRNRARFEGYFDKDNERADQLPVFTDWRVVASLASEFGASGEISEEVFTGKTLQVGTLSLNYRVDKVLKQLEICSERTGNRLKVTPRRLRRTLGTRAAAEGYGALVIAELLDHTDTQNAWVYIENVPEHVDAINRAVAEQLAPLAQAFAGVLVRDENEAKRGDVPASRIRSEDGSAGMGTCGHYGFCGALAPIACYTCQHFQPWVDGPHEEVLEALIERREDIKAKTGDMTMASINDRTIMAITQVVQMCREREHQLPERVIDER